jgi:hypothetical protein
VTEPEVNRVFSKDNAAGKPWEKCWQPDGPTRGRGFEAKGYLYPKGD